MQNVKVKTRLRYAHAHDAHVIHRGHVGGAEAEHTKTCVTHAAVTSVFHRLCVLAVLFAEAERAVGNVV